MAAICLARYKVIDAELNSPKLHSSGARDCRLILQPWGLSCVGLCVTDLLTLTRYTSVYLPDQLCYSVANCMHIKSAQTMNNPICFQLGEPNLGPDLKGHQRSDQRKDKDKDAPPQHLWCAAVCTRIYSGVASVDVQNPSMFRSMILDSTCLRACWTAMLIIFLLGYWSELGVSSVSAVSGLLHGSSCRTASSTISVRIFRAQGCG